MLAQNGWGLKTRLLRGPELWDNSFMMSGLFSGKKRFFCSFCKLPIRVYKSKDLSLIDVALLFFCVSGVSLFFTAEKRILTIVLFPILGFFMQSMVRIRWRESVKCRHCGFDPLVYKKNKSEAATSVKIFLEKRKKDPAYLLKPMPRLPVLVKEKDNLKQEALKKALENKTKISGKSGSLLDKSF